MARTNLSRAEATQMRAKRSDRPSEMTIPAAIGRAVKYVVEQVRAHPDWDDDDIAAAARTQMVADMRSLAAKSAEARAAAGA